MCILFALLFHFILIAWFVDYLLLNVIYPTIYTYIMFLIFHEYQVSLIKWKYHEYEMYWKTHFNLTLEITNRHATLLHLSFEFIF